MLLYQQDVDATIMGMNESERGHALSLLQGLLINRSESNQNPESELPTQEQTNQDEEEENRSTNQNNEPGNRASRQYRAVTDPDVFPSSATGLYSHIGDDDETVGEHDILYPYLEVVSFPLHPKYTLKGDVDSIYGYNSSLTQLLNDFMLQSSEESENSVPNVESIFSLPAVHVSARKMQGSRFKIDLSEIQDKPQLRNQPAKKISLERFPNVELGQLSVGFHRPMQIYLVNMGAKRLYKESYFSKTEIAVVNAASNMARQISLDFAKEQNKPHVAKAFAEFYPFKACYGTRTNQATVRSFNELTNEAMKVFSTAFMEAIDLIACDSSNWEFQKEELHQVVSDSSFEVKRAEMVLFAKELREGAVFVASLSGIKKFFDRKEFFVSNPDYANFKTQYEDILSSNEAQLVQEANQLLDPDIPYATQGSEDEYSGITQRLSLDVIDEDFPSYQNLFEKAYTTNISNSYNDTVKELCRRVDQHMKHILGVRNRETHVFFDIGVEVRLCGDNSLLVNPRLAFPIVQNISRLE